MIDRTKAIITLILAIIALIAYANRLEHRLTVIEQQNIAMLSTIESVDAQTRQITNYLYMPKE